MTARRRDRFLLVIGLASVLFGCSRQPLTVDDVIERNTRAMGGRAAIEAIHSIEIDLHIVDPGFEVDGIYRAVRPGRMRIDVQAGGKSSDADPKEKLVAGLKASMDYCGEQFSKMTDANLSEMVPFFGGRQITRMGAALAVVTDFADHYAGLSIHLRMNGLLPPTAQKKM